MNWRSKSGLCFCLFALIAFRAQAGELLFVGSESHDIIQLARQAGEKCQRFDNPSDALRHANDGDAILILADQYPGQRVQLSDQFFTDATAKHLRLFIEYPAAVPGLNLANVKQIVWERGVICSDAFAPALAKLHIVSIHGATYIDAKADHPLIDVARVAGFDTAVYGLPPTASPMLLEMKDGRWLIATTRLSDFVQSRFAPPADWAVIWSKILLRLDPDFHGRIKFTPRVRPSFGKDDPLPPNCQRIALNRAAEFYIHSRLLVSPQRWPEIQKQLAAGIEEIEMPTSEEPDADGSLGVLEGYSSLIRPDGTQRQRLPIRDDCQAETAMALAISAKVNGDANQAKIANNLLNHLFFSPLRADEPRTNPRHPSFGLIEWGIVAPNWRVANYGDDNARSILGTLLAAAELKTDRYDEMVLRALLANLRTTGKLGFRGERIDQPQLEAQGWKAFHDASPVDYSSHFESYLWAADLWAYRATHVQEFLDKATSAIALTMKVYPQGWRWQDNLERSRMLLCLSWLVRLQDTPEHRQWLMTVANDLLKSQDACGAIAERLGDRGRAGGFSIPQSNEAYGTGETPLIQSNDNKAIDELYTTGFALIGLREAVAATGDPKLKQAEDKLAEFLIRIQIKSETLPMLDGLWFRSFDFAHWDYWASSADIGWGAWSIETGWGQAWTAATFGLREQQTSFWDITADSEIADQLPKVQSEMAQNDGGPWIAKP